MVEKSLPRILTDGILGNLMGSSTPTKAVEAQSRGLAVFLVNTCKAKTKHEEGQLVQRELEMLKTTLTQPNLSVAQMKDYLCRLVFCHMLGYSVDFGCIHAVKLAQQGTLMEKKIGYLVCCLLLNRNHQLILLLINTLQKDLKSSNLLDNMFALSAASQLVPAEMIPSLLPLILAKLRHQRGFVRQKAVMCLFQFQLLAPDLLDHCRDDIEGALLDKDPGVMASAVNVLQHGIQTNAGRYIHTGDSLVDILQQITGRQMPAMFEYNNIQFPWLQIQIVRCLGHLAPLDDSLKKKTTAILQIIMKKASLKEQMAFAILYECIQCMIQIKADPPILDEAAEHVKRFLHSSDPNLKTIGVKLLVTLVQVNPDYSIGYQDFIVHTLDNPDTNIQRKMYCVLYGIASDSNIEVVCEKLLQQLHVTTDRFWKCELVTMLIDLITKFSRNVRWQIDSLFSTVQHGGDAITKTVTNTILSIIDTRFISAEDGSKSQQYLVQKCVSALVSTNTSHDLLYISLWAVGEVCPLLKNMADDKVVGLFTRLLISPSLPYTVHSSAVTCLHKLLLHNVVQPQVIEQKIPECCQADISIIIKQRLYVILGVCDRKVQLRCYDKECMDTTLTVLDDLVSDQLENGAATFFPLHLRNSAKGSSYSVEEILDECPTQEDVISNTRERTESTTSSSRADTDRDGGLDLPKVKRLWGKDGRLPDKPTSQVTLDNIQPEPISAEDKYKLDLSKALFGGKQQPAQRVDDNKGMDEGNSSTSVRNMAELSEQSTQSYNQARVNNMEPSATDFTSTIKHETLKPDEIEVDDRDSLSGVRQWKVGEHEAESVLHGYPGDSVGLNNGAYHSNSVLATEQCNPLEQDFDMVLSSLLDVGVVGAQADLPVTNAGIEGTEQVLYDNKFTNTNEQTSFTDGKDGNTETGVDEIQISENVCVKSDNKEHEVSEVYDRTAVPVMTGNSEQDSAGLLYEQHSSLYSDSD